jgi:hypothetical protein
LGYYYETKSYELGLYPEELKRYVGKSYLLVARKKTDAVPFEKDTGRLGSRPDLDLLLNDWGIHHLHLSDVDRGDGYVVRTGDLLFIAFRRDDAYLLDVLGHGAWNNQSLVDIATTNWLESRLFFHVPKMTWEFAVSERERKKLRNNGIHTPVQLSTGFAFGPGLTRGGTSAIIELKINKLWNLIAIDEMTSPHQEILEKVRNALDFCPFSDR